MFLVSSNITDNRDVVKYDGGNLIDGILVVEERAHFECVVPWLNDSDRVDVKTFAGGCLHAANRVDNLRLPIVKLNHNLNVLVVIES